VNPNEQRLKELQGKMEAIKAEMSQIKANMQSEKAAATIDEAVNIDRGRGLQGNRDAEGNMVTEEQSSKPTEIQRKLLSGELTGQSSLGPIKITLDKEASDAEAIDEAADKKIKETFHDMDFDYRKDEQSKKMRAGGISREQGRAKPMLDTSNDTMPGWTQDEAGNWSVDTESDYWSTKEGYKEAIQMYGFKPSFVSEPKKKGMVSSYKAPKRISL
tara:strand:+ start:5600 stop:6247 length:648 start_codon:yes stop_codon:yes gene_type:complete